MNRIQILESVEAIYTREDTDEIFINSSFDSFKNNTDQFSIKRKLEKLTML